jgi:hypothetical protein
MHWGKISSCVLPLLTAAVETTTVMRRSSLLLAGLGVGVIVLGAAALAFVRRRRAAAAAAAAASSSVGPASSLRGLVVHATPLHWGTRSLTVAEGRVTIVPVTDRATGLTLVALAVVDECADFPSRRAGGASAAADVGAAIGAVLALRNTRAQSGDASAKGAAAPGLGLDVEYDVSSLAVLPPQVGAAGADAGKAATTPPLPFTHTVRCAAAVFAGAAVAADAPSRFRHRALLRFDGATGTLLELLIDPAVIDDASALLVARNVSLSVTSERTASLVATVPAAALRVTVPASRWQLDALDDTPPRLLSGDGAVLTLDASVREQLDKTASGAASRGGVPALPSDVTAAATCAEMSEEQVVAAPRCGVTVVHQRLGVELAASPALALFEPRYAATTMLVVSVAVAATSERATITFEVWTDAPEEWFADADAKDAGAAAAQADELFHRDLRALLLPARLAPQSGPTPATLCGRAAVTLTAIGDGRRAKFFAVRRRAAGGRELLVARLESSAEAWPAAEAAFRRVLDGCAVVA